jgi:hypothetical protein
MKIKRLPFAVLAVFVLVLLGYGSSLCLAFSDKLLPARNATGFTWKKCNDDDRRHYCELISEKLGTGAKEWESYYKSLARTFDTSSPVTLKMSLDDTAKAVRDFAFSKQNRS